MVLHAHHRGPELPDPLPPSRWRRRAASPPRPAGRLPTRQVLYDENLEAEGHEFFSAGILAVSPDHRSSPSRPTWSATSATRLSFRPSTATATHRRDDRRRLLRLRLGGRLGHVFYTRVDDAWRPHQLWRHVLGSDPGRTTSWCSRSPTPASTSASGKTRDGEVIVVSVGVIDHDRDPSPRRRRPRRLSPSRSSSPASRASSTASSTSSDADGERCWLVVTNADGAVDFRLDWAPADGEQPSSWSTLIPHRPGVRLDGVDAFTSAPRDLRAGRRLRLGFASSTSTGRSVPSAPTLLETSWEVTTPERPQTTWLGANPEPELRRPADRADLDGHSHHGRRARPRQPGDHVLKQQEVPVATRPSDYVTYLDWATGRDGTRIPISIVAPSRAPRDWRRAGRSTARARALPALRLRLLRDLHRPELLCDRGSSLLDRGMVFAIAHVRGGGEMGRRWYDEGHLAAKHNTFDDFAAVAAHLVERGVTRPELLAARGGSAGGLLMGAVANRAGSSFRAVLAEVPFVDALNTMLDPTPAAHRRRVRGVGQPD